MKMGLERFDFYLNQLEKLLVEAVAEENVADWLYRNNARTTIFMLEGLAKLYGGCHDKKMFSKIGGHFKLLEDAIGAIDYYDSFAKEFAIGKASSLTSYLTAQTEEKIGRLNDLLIENNWIGEKANRIPKIRKKLADADWSEEKPEIKAIQNCYRKQIKEIEDFVATCPNGFIEIETQVHSLRRKLRWLSIYPQALGGCVQLNQSESKSEAMKKYRTPEIVNSPFNKMPAAEKNEYLLILDKDCFLALSWLIAELGKLKDNGLRILIAIEGLEMTKGLSREEALLTTYKLIEPNAQSLTTILATVSNLSKTFFAEKNLAKLVVGIRPKETKNSV